MVLGRGFNFIFLPVDIQVLAPFVEDYSFSLISLVVRKVKIKATMRLLQTHLIGHKKSLENNKCWQGWGELEPSFIAGGNVQPLWKQFHSL